MKSLFEYLLRLGDSSLILGHRLSEWCGHGPQLEEDLALTNVALDLVGRSTALLKYAGEVEGKGRTEDDLAFLRNEREFKNPLLVEQPNGDYASTIVRQFFFDVFSFYQFEQLQNSKDEIIKGVAQKGLKEINYHLRHGTDWVLRLGDGTEESHKRAQDAVDELWMFTGDLFAVNETDEVMLKEGIGADMSKIKTQWEKHVNEVLAKATLTIPESTFMQHGSLKGMHTEHLGFLLAEMQYMQRSYPGAKW